jgi:MFS transporter, FHS family, L-fucose permease
MPNDTLPPAVTNDKFSYILSITIIGVFFFIFGFVTWLNGVLIPYLRIACELNYFEAYFVAFAFYISYFVMAIPSAWILKRTGFKKGMATGLYIMAAGALMFVPAALTRTYGLFLSGLFILGTGLAILQTASNPYITILGPHASAARRISIMGICNKVAGVISPLVLGVIVLKDANIFTAQLKTMDALQKAVLLDSLASRVIIPYIVMALILVGLGFMVRFTYLPDVDTDREDESLTAANMGKSHILHFPQLVLGVIALFLYVGAEVIAGDTIIPYGLSQGIQLSEAKVFTSYTLTAMVIGYIIGIILIPKFLKQEIALGVSALIGLGLSILAISTSAMHWQTSFPVHILDFTITLPFDLSVFFIALLGLANAVMWPAIWPLAIDGLGRFTKIGASLLIMAIAGGALLPLLYGKLADLFTPHKAYWILIPCYIVICYYAFSGHKIRSWKKTF